MFCYQISERRPEVWQSMREFRHPGTHPETRCCVWMQRGRGAGSLSVAIVDLREEFPMVREECDQLNEWELLLGGEGVSVKKDPALSYEAP